MAFRACLARAMRLVSHRSIGRVATHRELGRSDASYFRSRGYLSACRLRKNGGCTVRVAGLLMVLVCTTALIVSAQECIRKYPQIHRNIHRQPGSNIPRRYVTRLFSLQLCVLRLVFFQDGDVGIGVFRRGAEQLTAVAPSGAADQRSAHQPGIARLQQFGRCTHILHSRIKPQVVAVWIKNDWHAVVDG